MKKTTAISDVRRTKFSFAALYMTPTTKQVASMKLSVEGVASKKSMAIPIVITVFVVSGYLAFALAANLFQWLFIVACVSIVVAIGIVVTRWTMERRSVRDARRGFIFENFANDNDLSYSLLMNMPEYPGVIFHSGESRKICDRLYANDNSFEVGNYEYTVRHGKSSSTYVYGYLRIQLKRRVAHMLLDSKGNNLNLFGGSFSNLPIEMTKDQVLSLEGDFDKYFTLYAPAEYERDALYVFTPDLMALLIDTVAEYDAEVIDDQLYIYGSEFNLMDPKTWEKITEIITTVGEKTIDRTDYYADERVGSRRLNLVAEQGKRLRKGVSWRTSLVIGFVLIYFILQIVMRQ